MAHQAHGIRWHALVGNLRYQPGDPQSGTLSDIVLGFKPTQAKEIDYFAESFARNVLEHTLTERAKYPAKYEPPGPEDVLIDDATAQRLNRVVYKWRTKLDSELRLQPDAKWTNSKALCPHESDVSEARKRDDPIRQRDEDDGFKVGCSCPLPWKERKASAFLRQYMYNDCYKFYRANRGAFLNLEVVKTLLLYGEMKPILRACSHPEADYAKWEDVTECYDVPTQLGWRALYLHTLDAYLVLNIIYCLPESWDAETRRRNQTNNPGPSTANDYRSTAMYQKMIRNCTHTDPSPITTYPHQDFFGIPDGHFTDQYTMDQSSVDKALARDWPVLKDFLDQLKIRQRDFFAKEPEFPHGKVPFEVFLNSTKTIPYLPSASDIHRVFNILRSKGLPPELVLMILKMAGYDKAERRLPIAHDPFHPDNQEELKKYLTFCWLTLVRCNMFAQELKVKIDWKREILDALLRCVGLPRRKHLFKYDYEANPDRPGKRIYYFLDAQGRVCHTLRFDA
ncbi:hypothetical protein BDW67DRAFT_164859 [Aspergillus spinulosporus]